MLILLIIVQTPARADNHFNPASGESWLDGWDYRKQITITGSSGAGTNYPISFDVNYGSGSDASNSIYCSSNCQTDFDDIRFTDDDGETELDYWLEEYTASDDASFWVEVADDLDSTQIIYMYYGNDAVSTTSNGENVFLFFDDFENNNLNRWTATDSSAWSTQSSIVARGTYAAKGNAQSSGRYLDEDWTDRTTNFALHFWVQKSATSRYILAAIQLDDGGHLVYSLALSSTAHWQYLDSGYQDYPSQVNYVANTWYEAILYYDFGNHQTTLYVGGSSYGTGTFKNDLGNNVARIDKLQILNDNLNNQLYIDDYYARNWISSEPYPSSYGSEETPPSSFIEITWSNYEPLAPYDDEEITLNCTVNSTLSLLTVYFIAVEYPDGFTDITNNATNTISDYWNYTFTSLEIGRYIFNITASDGIGINQINKFSYISITVANSMDVNIFYQLFLSTEIYGYFGAFILVAVGFILAINKKYRILAFFWFVIECLFMSYYFTLIQAGNGFYWWHEIFLILGGIFGCLIPASTKQ